MAVNKGDIRTSANYDVQIQAPLDARAVRPTKADLINKESWSYDGSTIYAYEGMQVFVEDEKKTYYLKDISKLTAADYSGWELMGTGAGGDIAEEVEVYIGDTEPTEDGAKLWINPAEEGGGGGGAAVEVVDNLESTDTTAALSANQGRVIADELAGKQDLLMDGINIKTINGEHITGRGNIVIEVGGTPVEVINSLESESTTAALSANQGKVLNEGKQDALVSGTNIKTINGNSLLGSGNITIEGGGGGGGNHILPSEIYDATSDNPYIFTEEEAAAFLALGANTLTTIFSLTTEILAGYNYCFHSVVVASQAVGIFTIGFLMTTNPENVYIFTAMVTQDPDSGQVLGFKATV